MSEALDYLAFELFRTFARFEYALKITGFDYGDGAAKPNWRAFAESESVRNIFDNPTDNVLKTAIEYILTHPPKKQTIENGVLTWNEHPPSTDLQSDLVLTYVRRVRNNLFHGGKFNGRWFEPERSEELLKHSLTILHWCQKRSHDVGEAYRNGE